jgi:hypothetical protein
MGPFLLATFLSALLLFQVQPIIARYILPLYGGSASLWTACMMFFQGALLLGYLYAHVLGKRVPAKRQPVVHGVLLGLSLLLLPIGPPASWTPDTAAMPGIEIPVLLAISVGVPFVLIAASGPLLQRWYAGVFPGRSPFRLYALSNFGSLVGLLAYPFLIEPAFALSKQTAGWSLAYVALAVLFAVCGYRYWQQGTSPGIEPGGGTLERAVTIGDRLLWVALAACGSTMLLAITNQICQDVAVFPFLWILPLSLYLLSFIIAFERDAWYRRAVWWPVLAIALALVIDLMFEEFTDDETSLIAQVGIYSFALFSCCMVCHGELVRARSAVGELTTFYLYVALGGALGGVFVNILAPAAFTGFWELHIGLVSTVLLAGVCLARDTAQLKAGARRLQFGVAWGVLVAALSVAMAVQVSMGREDSIHVARGFFGVLSVDEWDAGDSDHQRQFYHGRIRHGQQLMATGAQRRATTYYGVDSGVANAIVNHPGRRDPVPNDQGLNIGIVGMGVGTLSVYGSGFDTFRFYEINPQVVDIARDYFSFLDNARAETSIVLGDARLSMQRELDEGGSNGFDVLVLDAFSGDAIPVHLLTEEAMALYLKHLEPDGILAIHITNYYVDLSPVVLEAAERFGLSAVWVEDYGERWYEDTNDWVLLTSNTEFLRSPELSAVRTPWPSTATKRVHWTDDFSNLFELISWNE